MTKLADRGSRCGRGFPECLTRTSWDEKHAIRVSPETCFHSVPRDSLRNLAGGTGDGVLAGVELVPTTLQKRQVEQRIRSEKVTHAGRSNEAGKEVHTGREVALDELKVRCLLGQGMGCPHSRSLL